MSVPRGPSLTCRERLGEAHGDFSIERSRSEERAGRRILPRAGRSAPPPGSCRSGARGCPPGGRSAGRQVCRPRRCQGRAARRESKGQQARRAGARAVVRSQNPESHQPKPVAQPGSATRVEGWLLLCRRCRLSGVRAARESAGQKQRGLERSVARAVRPPSLPEIHTPCKKLHLP